jgi:arginase
MLRAATCACSFQRRRAPGAYSVGMSQSLLGTALGLLGAPTSMASFAPGQEKAPRALREAGILDALQSAGVEVRDYGDLPVRRWVPDRVDTRAQNAAAVIDDAIEVRDRIGPIIGSNQRHLVLGGSCAIEIGVVAGYLAAGFERLGVVYADLHTDLNTPQTTGQGALDWMVTAHLLDVPDSVDGLASVGSRRPLLQPRDLAYWGVNLKGITAGERASVDRLGLRVVDTADAIAEPTGSMSALLDGWAEDYDAVLVHLDVDLINFLELPLSEEITRVGGMPLAAAADGVRTALRLSNAAGLTVTEVNPDHDPDGHAIQDLVATIATVFRDQVG